jgi:serine/threonine-protein kinase HipA
MAGKTITVGFQGTTVGILRRHSANVGDIEFLYSSEWLSHPLRFPVSGLMPLTGATYGPDIVYPWFLNLLPEGSALQTVGAILHVHEQDVIAMLEEMGADLPGALTIPLDQSKPGLRPRYHMLTDAELAEIIRELPARPMLVGRGNRPCTRRSTEHPHT